MNPLEYFWLFFKASLLSTGGLGNALLAQGPARLRLGAGIGFLTAIAVGQISPGPSGLWSISLGYLTYGWLAPAGAPGVEPAYIVDFWSFGILLSDRTPASGPRLHSWVGTRRRGPDSGCSVQPGISAITDYRGLLIALVALTLALTKRVP